MKNKSFQFKFKTALLFFATTLFFTKDLNAQNNFDVERPGTQCDVRLSPNDLAIYKDAVSHEKKDALQSLVATIFIPVRLHIVRTASGTGGITEAQAEQELASANTKFAPAGIQFFQCKSVEYIDDNTIFNTAYSINEPLSCGSTGPAYLLCNAHNLPNACNIYWVNVQGNWNWGSFPWYVSQNCADKLMMNINGIGSSWLLAHELGHYFGLLHTFETANGAENVTRNTSSSCYNALSAGDLLDDTPADPNSWNTCNYAGGLTDACGASYSPDPQNEMCYANGCQTFFTNDQINRMINMNSQYRGYLSCSYVSSCNSTWTISAPQITDYAYQASSQINSSAVINTGVTSVYDAGNRIILTTGFRTSANTSFRGNIKPCYSSHIFNKGEFEVPQSVIQDETLNLNAYPNPIQSFTTLQFTIGDTRHIRVHLTDLSGRKIMRDIINETKPAGTYEEYFDTSELSNGIYLCVLEENNNSHILKLVVNH